MAICAVAGQAAMHKSLPDEFHFGYARIRCAIENIVLCELVEIFRE